MNDADSWEDSVAQGDFHAIPSPFKYRNSSRFAHLLDGYRFAGNLAGLAELARERVSLRRAGGPWQGSALELWAILFFFHRASRHGGTDDEDAEDPFNDDLCEALRVRLVALTDAEKATVLAELAFGPAFGRPDASRER